MQPTRVGDVYLCDTCLPNGSCQFGIKSGNMVEPLRYCGTVRCPARFEGGRGVAHGGWTAAILDEVLGGLGGLNGVLTVTATLTVDYLRPVPIEVDLNFVAWRDRKEGRRWHNIGELRLPGGDIVLAVGRGQFSERDAAHFNQYDQWLAKQIRPSDSLEPPK